MFEGVRNVAEAMEVYIKCNRSLATLVSMNSWQNINFISNKRCSELKHYVNMFSEHATGEVWLVS